MSQIENIGKKDVLWSYISTLFTIGAGILLLPFMLNKMPAEDIGVWTLFQTVTLLIIMLDFGFRPSFSRNVSYIFSGVDGLLKEGVIHHNPQTTNDIDYALLRGALIAMQRFYRWLALAVFILLSTIGTFYFYFIFNTYKGDVHDVWFAWLLMIISSSWDLYTYYYDALLTGKGYIKRQQQITIIGQGLYILLAIILIYMGYGLTAIVGARLVSIVVRRIMTYHSFFTKDLKKHLNTVTEKDPKKILQSIYPNAIKVGLVGIGSFIINRSAMLMGGILLPLEIMASYGITMQVVDIIVRCSVAYYQSYVPKIAQYRVENNYNQLGLLYRNSIGSLIALYFIGSIVFVFLGDWALIIINSQTQFLPLGMLIVILLFNMLEQIHSASAGFIMADNRIPFFLPSLLSALGTLILLTVFLYGLKLGIWGLILAPGLAQLCYQNWKWPMEVCKEIRQNKTH